MLDIKWIRDNPQALAKALVDRQWSQADAEAEVTKLIDADEARRAHLGKLQSEQERRNQLSKEIGNAMRAGNSARAEELKQEVAGIKAFIQNGEAEERTLDAALRDALAVIPNIPLPDVPVGADEAANTVLRTVGEKPRMNFKPKEHFELGEALGMMDFERAAKISGSRFTILKGPLARLERALGQFMLDLHTSEHGYEEVQPPLLVRQEAMFGTAQLPKFKVDLYPVLNRFEQLSAEYKAKNETYKALDQENKWLGEFQKKLLNVLPGGRGEEGISDDIHEIRQSLFNHFNRSSVGFSEFSKEFAEMADEFRQIAKSGVSAQFLIPTAEVPLTNLVRDEILDVKSLPRRYTALTPCFRSEAGSAGRDTRGMLRQHQFNKVELVSITDEKSSLDEHERMTQCAEEVLKRLGLPFRTMVLSTGDMGFGARKTHDIEVWLPGQDAYREISSCSVCGDFQARRMDARYRPEGDSSTGSGQGKTTRYVHTLNGSGVAVGRALIAVMENYQNADGSVTIPEVLQPYMGGMTKIEAR